MVMHHFVKEENGELVVLPPKSKDFDILIKQLDYIREHFGEEAYNKALRTYFPHISDQ